MNLKNCPECGKMYMENAFGMCENCKTKEEEGFIAIKDYIYENPTCALRDLSDATGVAIKRILTYIREGRLVATEGMAADVTCRGCGAPIRQGVYCETCSVKMTNEVKDLYEDGRMDARLHGPKMHISRK
jgi:hypothetical protein